jgi:hypothetical protein
MVRGEWSALRLSRFIPGERDPCTHWLGGWVGPRAGLDDVEKRKFLTLSVPELRPLGLPARSQSHLELCVEKNVSYKNIACKTNLFHLLHSFQWYFFIPYLFDFV